MKTLKTIAVSVFAFATTATNAAFAQDYLDWGSISPYGLEMVDELGNVHYVDPYAYDSQVDIYGNVVSSYNTQMDPTLGMSDLTPAWGASTNTGTANSSSWSEYDSTAYTMKESNNWSKGGLYDTTWMFD